jgi:microsomal epoxide hydrolase
MPKRPAVRKGRLPEDFSMAHQISRRDLLSVLPVPFLVPRPAQPRAAVRPFTVNIPQAVIDRIIGRVKGTRLPDRLDARDWRYGVNWEFMKALTEYWTTGFDWRKAEANLNRYPQFLARVGDFDIHFYHVKGRGPKPLPLVLTHGWPGSVFEFIEAIGPLSDPARFGGSPDDAFDVVVPSIPGFGFSSKPKAPIGPPTVARLWHALMTETLGYSRFGAQGGDWGGAITRALARQFSNSLAGVHLNMAVGTVPPESELTDEERTWLRAAGAYRAQELDYFNEQQHKPGTVSFVLYDNPVGTAAWIVEKFKVWSDSGDDIERTFTKDQLLTNVMIYLVTDTTATAVWIYRGSADDDPGPPPREPSRVPVGVASFPAEMALFNPPRTILERSFNLVHYTRMPRGGHFACLEQPQLFVEDVRKFFRALRS